MHFTTKLLFLIASLTLISSSVFADLPYEESSFDPLIQIAEDSSNSGGTDLAPESISFDISMEEEKIVQESTPLIIEDKPNEATEPLLTSEEILIPAVEAARLENTLEPRIQARYYSADAVQALPRLKSLAALEPEHNKIILKLEGFPKNQEIFFDVKRLASPNPESYETKMSFSIQDDGTMLITNTDQRLSTFACSSRGYLPGEPVTFRFRTADNKISKEISGIPTPAVIRNKEHQIVLKAELLSDEPTVYNILLPMMKEGEAFEIKATSINAIVKGKTTYKKDMPPLHYAPAANGKKGGDAVFEIRKKSGEVYVIMLPWGAALAGYHHNKVYSPVP